MSSLKRYSLSVHEWNGHHELDEEEDPDGRYVLFEDANRELEELREQVRSA